MLEQAATPASWQAEVADARAALAPYFRPPGAPAWWRSGATEHAGWLLEGGVLFDARGSPPGAVGAEEDGTLHVGEEDARRRSIPAVRRLALEFRSARFGTWARPVPEVPDDPAFRAEAERTATWIRDGLGPSEFRWDTLAVERSMLRLLMGAVYFDRVHPQWRLAQLLFEGTQVPEATVAIAAAMAEFDAQGKRLSNDYYYARPAAPGEPPTRDLVHRHLLVCCGRFLSNYKRRFLIQNPWGLDDATRIELHRTLIVCDLTEESIRAVYLDWLRQPDGVAGIPAGRLRKNLASLWYSEHADCALRLWQTLAQPPRLLHDQVERFWRRVAMERAAHGGGARGTSTRNGDEEADLASRTDAALADVGDLSLQDRLSEYLRRWIRGDAAFPDGARDE